MQAAPMSLQIHGPTLGQGLNLAYSFIHTANNYFKSSLNYMLYSRIDWEDFEIMTENALNYSAGLMSRFGLLHDETTHNTLTEY